ncbi:PAS domain S-box protein [Roseospirillum parvum]|uniref:histidine kinase n=1 Tax=Roseospirillum parvum TaxID=83401 RepID=A0A1G7U8D7_9PROT|nr:PAS domain S-box protein [Roseospirillum parvum]SDG43836.1 PAS domain S-box-containing protein [Roseospirillum parvum]
MVGRSVLGWRQGENGHGAFGLMLMAAVGVLVLWFAFQAWTDYRHELAFAEKDLHDRLTLVRSHHQHAFHLIDVTLQALVAEVEQARRFGTPRAPLEEHENLRRLSGSAEVIGFLALIDRRGRVRVSSTHYPLDPTVWVEDRPYFQALAQEDRLFVGEPMQARGGIDQWFLGMARRINDPDGSFAGVALASASPLYFQGFYGSGTGVDELSTLLISPGGQVVAAAVPGLAPGQSLIGHPLAEAARHLELPLDSLRRQPGPETGGLIERRSGALVAVSELDNVPLRLVMVQPLRTVIRAWSERLLLNLLLLAMAVTLLGAVWVALRRVEAERDRFFDVSPEMVCVTGFDHRLRRVNPAWEAVLGYPSAELVGRDFNELLHPRDIDPTADAVARLAQGEVVRDLRNRLIARDGHQVWLSWSAVAHGGRVYAVSRDISAQVQASRALEASEARLRGIFDNVIDAILMLDEEGKVLAANRTVEQIFGYTAKQLTGQNIALISADWEATHLESFVGHFLAAETEILTAPPVVVAARRRDGSRFPLELGLSEVCEEEGERVLIAVCRDITERQRLEQMKDEVVATISHELRTPITAIHGALGLLAGGRAGELSDKAAGLVRLAHDNCHRLVELVNDILDIHRLEAGGMPFTLAPVDLAQVAAQAVAEMATYDSQSQVELVLDGDEPGLMVRGDQRRLGQVLSNLLSNAIKFSPPGGRVEVRLRPAGDWVEVAVIDQGPGIPAELRPRLFERFTQGSPPGTGGRRGSGLGLSIVKALLDRHRGHVQVDSEPGQGATFRVYLPRLDGPEDTLPRPPEEETAP